MRWTFGALLGLALAGTSAALADDDSRLKLARQVVEIAHAGDNMRAISPIMAQQRRALLSQQGNANKPEIDTYVKRFQERFDHEIPDFVDLVAKEFTDDNLANLLVFYRTLAGQHLLGKQQEIARGLLLTGQEWRKPIGEEVLCEMQKDKAAQALPNTSRRRR